MGFNSGFKGLNVGLHEVNWKVQLFYWPWKYFCVPENEIFPKITFWMIELAKLVDYCFFFNICSGTHESEVWNSLSLCQEFIFRLNPRNSQLACSGLLALVGALQIYDFLSNRGTTKCSLEIPIQNYLRVLVALVVGLLLYLFWCRMYVTFRLFLKANFLRC